MLNKDLYLNIMHLFLEASLELYSSFLGGDLGENGEARSFV